MDSPVEIFKSGTQNLLQNEIIPQDAAQDALGWITQDGKLILVGGRQLIGIDSGTTGIMRGLHYGNCVDGSQVLYRKTETKLQYLLNGTWTDILTGLTPGTEASFANYSSLAGQFTFFVTTDGYWKINNAFPMNPVNMYNPALNFHGRILIDKGRTLLWDRNDAGGRDRTTLYGSRKDTQDAPYYTYVQNQVEITGDGTTKSFSGVIGTTASNLLRSLCNLFGLTVWAPTGPALTVTAITNASQAQITTSTAHGLSANNSVVFGGVQTNVPVAGTGTVSFSGNYGLTGSGTYFTTQLKVGATIYVNVTATVGAVFYPGGSTTPYSYTTAQTGIVRSIASNTSLTVQFPWSFGLANENITYSCVAQTFVLLSMSQLTNTACSVVNIIDTYNFTINVNSTNFPIYTSGETVNQAEVLVDNGMGHLSAISGATGTINYITGTYTFNFINAPSLAASVVSTYSWENSSQGGITDFTASGTRLAGDGFILPQDKGGDPIMNVLIGQDGGYYSMKQQRAYQLVIGEDDVTVTNQIYYENMGIPSLNSGVATQKGIIFLNTSNPDKPEMTLLVKNVVSATLTPSVISPNFKFSLYDFSDAYFNTYERYILISCKEFGATQNNRILLCNISDGAVDVSPYEARMFASDSVANLYVGSPLQENVYQIFSGFDDLGNPVQNYWIGAGDQYGSLKSRMARWRFIREELKKFRKYNVKGMIGLDQVVQVYFSFDDAPFQLVGTIRGRGTYVDSGSGQAIGSNFIGQQQIGGDQIVNVYPYFCQLAMAKIPKFRKRTVKFVATGVGYFDINFLSDFDIMLFENRLPTRFRSKQLVSLDGTLTDQ